MKALVALCPLVLPSATACATTSAQPKSDLRIALKRSGLTDIAECDVPTGAGGRRRRFAVSGFSPRGNQVLIQFFSSTHDAQLFEQRYVEPGEKGVRVCNVVIGFNDHDAFVDRVVSCLRKRCG